MNIVKKNLVSIICGVIAILAIVGNFWPMGGKRTALKEEASAHAAKAAELKTLLTKQRNLPIVKPGQTESEPLPGFPTHQALEEAHKVTDLVNKAADALMTRASGESNVHVPLVDRALPGQPGDTLPASSFARAYVSMFPPPMQQGNIAVLPAASTPVARPAGSPPALMDILHAGSPPNDLELQAARDAKQKEIEADAPKDPRGQMTNPQDVQASVLAAFKTLADDMRSDRAKKCKTYVAPDAFSLYPGMVIGAQPLPSDIFWAQIGLWVQQDLCSAISEMNDPFPSVLEAPVKQVVKISFLCANQPNTPPTVGAVPVFVMPNLQPSAGVGNGGGGPEAMPAAPGGDQAAPAQPLDVNPDLTKTRNTLLSPTGRISNGVFDVVQFDVELIVDAATVPQVLENLGSKRYISVIQVESIESVDSAFFRGGGYYFGPKPCVKIKARCEELFFRSWLGNYVPDRLKTILLYPTTPAPAAPT